MRCQRRKFFKKSYFQPPCLKTRKYRILIGLFREKALADLNQAQRGLRQAKEGSSQIQEGPSQALGDPIQALGGQSQDLGGQSQALECLDQ